jgi:hypothetical protein
MKHLLALALGLLLGLLTLGAQARGLQFSEQMSGTAYVDGEFRNASVSLKVVINDIDAWSKNLNIPASMTGTLYVDRMPAQPITGTLTILAPAPNDDGRLLTYRFTSATLQFTGLKHVRDKAAVEVFDEMTTLEGVFQPLGATPPSVQDLLYNALWSTELHFAWWDPSVVWNFAASFVTIDTPWYQVLQVEGIFVKTVFGALAHTLFPWLC